MKRLLLASTFVVLSALAAPPLVPVAAAQGQPSPALSIPVTSPNFAGTFNLRNFTVIDGVVNAVGTLTGILTTPNGPVSVARTVALPVAPAQITATCDILHLELGPLDLNLLGLVVHLDRIVLDIDAQSGPGNLLGNLLCSVAGLLDNPGGLAKLLNQILSIIA